MEAAAESEIQNISAQAALTTAAIRSSAAHEADRRRRQHLEDADRRMRRERTRALNRARAEELRETSTALDELFDQTIAAARLLLSNLRNKASYKPIIARLINEAVAEIDADAVIHADARDEPILNELRPGARVEFDLNTCGGVEVRTGDGRITVRNTFEARLENARETMKHEVIGLFEGREPQCTQDTTTETHVCAR
ncbi:MAG TPA: V-type ATP synthase subunit E family protein [Blastocatellia bacterium]|nr:V-type ATP synthase subunit E family protein [Blastocatellia bacterium]